MTQVFISYSRENSALALFLRDHLQLAQPSDSILDIWIDIEDIEYSVPWWARILKGIDESSSVIIVVSNAYFASEICNEELEYAKSLNKRIIPILLEGFDDETIQAKKEKRDWSRRDETLIAENLSYLRTLNWINGSLQLSIEEIIPLLINTIFQDIEHADAHKEYLSKAKLWVEKENNNSFLLKGKAIDEAENWLSQAAGKQPALLPLQTEYILSSRRTQQRSQRNQLGAVSFALIVMFILAIIAFTLFRQSESNLSLANIRGTGEANQAGTAIHNANIAATNEANAITARNRSESLRLASEADALLQADSKNVETSVLLALRGLQFDHTARAQNTLQTAISQLNTSQIFRVPQYDDAIRIAPSGEQLLFQHDSGSDAAFDLVLMQINNNQFIQTFSGHTSGLTRAVFSADGKYLLSSDTDYKVFLWDTQTGQHLQTFTGFSNLIAALAFSSDNRLVFTADVYGQTYLWDRESGEQLSAFQAGLLIVDAAFLSDDRHVVLASVVGAVEVWEAFDVKKTRQSFGDEATSLLLSKDGTRLFIGYSNGSITLWDVETETPIHEMIGHTSDVVALAESPDGTQLASSSNPLADPNGTVDPTVRLWEITSGNEVNVLSGHTAGVTDVEYAANGMAIISLSEEDDTIRRWGSSNSIGVQALASGDGFLVAMDAAQNGQYTATIHADVDLASDMLNDLTLGAPFDDKYLESMNAIWLTLWETATGQLIFQVQLGDTVATAIRFNPDGSNLAIYGSEGDTLNLSVFSIPSGELIYTKTYNGDYLEFSPNGLAFVVSQNRGQQFSLVETRSGDILQEQLASTFWVGYVFSEDGRYVAVYEETIDNSEAANIFVWDIATGSEQQALADYVNGDSSVFEFKASFSPDGQYFMTLLGSFLNIWETDSGEKIDIFSNTAFPNIGDARFTPDSQSLVIGYDVFTMRDAEQYSLEDGELVQTFSSADDGIKNIYISPDGTAMLMENLTNAVLYDMRSGERIAEITQGRIIGRGPIYEWANRRVVTFSPMGTSFVTVGIEEIYLWDSHTGELLDVASPVLSSQASNLGDAAYAGDDDLLLHINHINLDSDKALSWEVTKTLTGYNRWIEYACSILPRDLTDAEKNFYLIRDNNPTCFSDLDTSSPPNVVGQLYASDILESTGGYLVQTHDELVIDLSEDDDISRWIPLTGGYSDYVLGTTVEWGEGEASDYCGVLFGLTNNENFFAFVFNQLAIIAFQEFSNGEWGDPQLRDYRPTLNLGVGSTNQLILVVANGEAQVFINNEAAASFVKYNESQYIPEAVAGGTGLLGGTGTESGKSSCTFRDTWLWDLNAVQGIIPTVALTATPSAYMAASLGDNKGELTFEERDIWYFDGRAGDIITIEVIAENPANDAQDRTGLLDTVLFVRSSQGNLVAEADDIERAVLTNSKVSDFELPFTGRYEIEVSSFDGLNSGNYTLRVTKVH